MVIEGIARRQYLHPQLSRLRFRAPDLGQLRLREYHAHQQSVIHGARRRWPQDVVGGNFALLDRNVHNLVRPAAVSRSQNVFRRRPLLRIGPNSTTLQPYSRRTQAQRLRGGHPAQRMQHFLRSNHLAPARLRCALKNNLPPLCCPTRVEQPSPRMHHQSFASEGLLHFNRGRRVKITQQVGASLDHRHLGPQSCEELRELDRNRPAAKDGQ